MPECSSANIYDHRFRTIYARIFHLAEKTRHFRYQISKLNNSFLNFQIKHLLWLNNSTLNTDTFYALPLQTAREFVFIVCSVN